VSPAERRERLGQAGAVVWLEGATSRDSALVAYALERRLFDLGHVALAIDPSQGSSSNVEDSIVQVVRGGLIAIAWPATPEGADSAGSSGPVLAERGVRDIVRVHVRSGGADASASSGARAEGADGVLSVSLAGGAESAEAAAESIVAALRELGVFQ
jgi:hypothetical protein